MKIITFITKIFIQLFNDFHGKNIPIIIFNEFKKFQLDIMLENVTSLSVAGVQVARQVLFETEDNYDRCVMRLRQLITAHEYT